MEAKRRGESFFSTEEEAARRWSICTSCEHFKEAICKKCNCYMPFKINVAEAKCGNLIDKGDDKWQI